MSRINALTIAAAEAQALELDAKGEKWGAHAIISLLAIIEDLTAKPQKRSYDQRIVDEATGIRDNILADLGRDS